MVNSGTSRSGGRRESAAAPLECGHSDGSPRPPALERSDSSGRSRPVAGSRRRSLERERSNEEVRDGARRDAARQHLHEKIKEHGGGSALRGWRRELDPDGHLCISEKELFRGAKRLGFQGNVADATGGAPSLSLQEVAPADWEVLNRFRLWVKETFGGPAEMFQAFDVAEVGYLTFESFQRGCQRKAYGSPQELGEIYKCCDPDESNEVRKDDFLFLETDEVKRSAEMAKKAGAAQKDQYKRMQADVWLHGSQRYPPHHRCAGRPWLAVNFEKLPSLICTQREDRRNMLHQRSQQARIAFLKHLRKSHGNEVRAWRRELDKGSNFGIPFKDFANYCARFEVDVDVRSLWKSIDGDGDDCLRLEEVAPVAADALAKFQMWATGKCGSVAALWEHPACVEARGAACELMVPALVSKKKGVEQGQSATSDAGASAESENGEIKATKVKKWPTTKKMLFGTFAQALKALEWPAADDPETRHTIFSALDSYGLGFVCRSDFEWLDKWAPADWIVAEPDPTAFEALNDHLLRIYKHPLRAWRCCLDDDNSNCVSWIEFKAACDKIRWSGNIGGAWRHLDQDLSGAISMKEYDETSAELLVSFKQWADENFGSVRAAFKALDETKLGILSFSALKKACRRLQWRGDVRILFDCLDTDSNGKDQSNIGKRSLSMKDISFLDTWEIAEYEDDPEFEDLTSVFGDVRRPRRRKLSSGHSRGQRSSPALGARDIASAPPCAPHVPSVSDRDAFTPKSASISVGAIRARSPGMDSKGSRSHSLWDLESMRGTTPKEVCRSYSNKGSKKIIPTGGIGMSISKTFPPRPWLQKVLDIEGPELGDSKARRNSRQV